MKILDLNVLLYCTDATSEFHARAKGFVDTALQSDEIIGLPWTVLLGFLRISTRRIRGAAPMSREQAFAVLDAWLSHPNVTPMSPGPQHWTILRDLADAAEASGNLMPDAHLAALAIENGAELCSADTDFARFPRLHWTDPTRDA